MIKNNNMLQYELLRLKEDDIASIMAIEKLSYPDPWTIENFLGELRRPFTVALGLKNNNNTLIAHCFFWLIAPEVHLLNLAVHPDFRGQGLGRRLINTMINLAQIGKADRIFLEVRHDNTTALNLYKSMGFIISGRRPDYYQDGCDALLMTFSLK